MKHFLFIIVFLSGFFFGKASSRPLNDSWSDGILILKNQETLKGEIIYNMTFEVVQIKLGDKIKTYTPYNVQYFQVYDEGLKRSRVFAAVDANLENKNRRGKKFFLEVLIKGEMLLLQKEEIKNLPAHKFTSSDISFKPTLEYSDFVFFKNNLIEIKNFEKDVLPFMADEESEINVYILSRKLNLHQFEHQALIIDFYNYLKDPSRPALEDQRIARN